LQMNLMAKGVVVVSPGQSIAANQGFQAGDIVKSVNGEDIHTVRQLKQALEAGAQQGGWNLEVNRGGQRLSLSIRY
ncbi:MAG: PDZ domain-containing protein, partial [Alphaproteobacteria bacterium]|nr:PDZ domain-containing protein [Alphaproteobacteria bacterium]